MQDDLGKQVSEGITKAILDKLPKFFGWVSSLFQKRLPRNKERIGVVVAIRAKDSDTFLSSEFIRPLERKLRAASDGKQFNFYTLPKERATQVTDRGSAEKILKRMKCQLMIFGELSSGPKHKGEAQHIFRLHGVVRHADIPKIVSHHFGKEFALVLPSMRIFPVDDELAYFEFTNTYTALVIEFIIAVAQLLSGERQLSRQLLEDVLDRLNKLPNVNQNHELSQLKNLVARKLVVLLTAELQILNRRFVKTRGRDLMMGSSDLLNSLLELDPEHYGAKLTLAIKFFFEGKHEEAILLLEPLNHPDPTWRFSLAFLYSYKGEIDKALEQYKKTFYKVIEGETLLHIEMFMSEVIENSPDKTQLVFFRGLINFKHKNDKISAKKDFEEFLEKSASSFPRLKTLAEKYLSEMR